MQALRKIEGAAAAVALVLLAAALHPEAQCAHIKVMAHAANVICLNDRAATTLTMPSTR